MAWQGAGQRQSESRLELLPVELQLTLLERSSYKDLTSLIISSRPYHATYLRHKKSILAHITQATLEDSFVDACMLQLWEGHLNRCSEDEDDRVRCARLANWRNLNIRHATAMESMGCWSKKSLERDPFQWPRGLYRHVQLKFIHDYDQYATAGRGLGEQIRDMQNLLTAEDFYQILWYHDRWPRRLVSLCVQDCAMRRDLNVVNSIFYGLALTHGPPGLSLTRGPPDGCPMPSPEPRRIMKAIYRSQICDVLYGQMVRLGTHQVLAMGLDFLERFDRYDWEIRCWLRDLEVIGRLRHLQPC